MANPASPATSKFGSRSWPRSRNQSRQGLGRRARGWKRPEQLLEGMAALSRIDTDLGPLQLYLMLNEVDRRRPSGKHLTPETVLLLASKFSQLSNWYLVFSEFPDLTTLRSKAL